MRVKECFRIAFLYVGLSVGAGFATGKEINLYFQGANVFTLIVSGLITSVFCFVFLSVGRLDIIKSVKIERLLNVLYGIGGLVVSALMLSCIREVFHFEGFILIILCSMLCMALALNSSKGVKLFTGASVPIIVVCCLMVSIKCNLGISGGSFKVIDGIKYSAMNMFFQCAFITKEGKNVTLRESVLISFIVGITITLLLIPMYSVVRFSIANIPFLKMATEQGLSYVAIIEILFAIMTTITSCYTLSLEMFENKHILWVLFIIIASISLSMFSFSKAVAIVYPIISYIGFLLFFFAVIGIIVDSIKRKGCRKRCKKYG